MLISLAIFRCSYNNIGDYAYHVTISLIRYTYRKIILIYFLAHTRVHNCPIIIFTYVITLSFWCISYKEPLESSFFTESETLQFRKFIRAGRLSRLDRLARLVNKMIKRKENSERSPGNDIIITAKQVDIYKPSLLYVVIMTFWISQFLPRTKKHK